MVRSIAFRISTALAVTLAAGAILVASGAPATANNGDAVRAGQTTTATTVTIVNDTSGGVTCAYGSTDGLVGCGTTGLVGNGTLYGVEGVGSNGVFGLANGNSGSTGVYGSAFGGVGTGYGVYGTSSAQTGYGVYGISTTGYGLWGQGVITGTYGTSSTDNGIGVQGEETGTHGYGVWGEASSTTGTGIYGIATATSGTASGIEGYSNSATGFGVFGSAPGIGVKGTTASADGVGVRAENTSTGLALAVSGRVSFSTVGIAVVPSGQKKVTVSLAGTTATDFVLATVQGNNAFSVRGALAGTGQITIWLNKATTAAVSVAYFVLSAS
jgi:hypothetical protein